MKHSQGAPDGSNVVRRNIEVSQYKYLFLVREHKGFVVVISMIVWNYSGISLRRQLKVFFDVVQRPVAASLMHSILDCDNGPYGSVSKIFYCLFIG